MSPARICKSIQNTKGSTVNPVVRLLKMAISCIVLASWGGVNTFADSCKKKNEKFVFEYFLSQKNNQRQIVHFFLHESAKVFATPFQPPNSQDLVDKPRPLHYLYSSLLWFVTKKFCKIAIYGVLNTLQLLYEAQFLK